MDKEDEFSLFAREMRGVRRITTDRADTGRKPADRTQQKLARQHAVEVAGEVVVDGLSDQYVLDVTPEEFLFWGRDGVQDAQLRRLRAGQIAFEGSLDLHGMTVESARGELWAFLAEAIRLEVRCVRVTHGKSNRLDGRKPMLKSHINTWLRQHGQVLGFVSCQPRHGGTGAVYILLKRNMLEGREEEVF